MKCAQCNEDMMIAGSKFISEVDSTDVYTELKLVCVNPKCPSYAGTDLTNATVYTSVRNKVN